MVAGCEPPSQFWTVFDTNVAKLIFELIHLDDPVCRSFGVTREVALYIENSSHELGSTSSLYSCRARIAVPKVSAFVGTQEAKPNMVSRSKAEAGVGQRVSSAKSDGRGELG